MQNQRNNALVPALYKSEWDCAKQVLRNEGFLGLYRGAGVQALVNNILFGNVVLYLTSLGHAIGYRAEQGNKVVYEQFRSGLDDRFANRADQLGMGDSSWRYRRSCPRGTSHCD
jgi:hypothetical protein